MEMIFVWLLLCSKHILTNELRMSNLNAFNLVGLFPIRLDDMENINNNFILQVESMKFAIQKANEKLNQSLFGYSFYDTYGVDNYNLLTEALMDVMLNGEDAASQSCPVKRGSIYLNSYFGVVGPASSSHTAYAHNLLVDEELPVVSYSSTSAELSDKSNYPALFRTIPPDTTQGHFIAKMVSSVDWNYVSVIASDTFYGRAGFNIMRKALDRFNVCRAVEMMFTYPRENRQELEDIWLKVKQEKWSNVIILWGGHLSVHEALSEAIKLKLYNKTWIFSEASARSEWLIDMEKKLFATFLSVVEQPQINESVKSEFKDYFLNLKKSDGRWLAPLFRNGNHRISENFFDFSHFGFVYNAVNALISSFNAFNNVSECLRWNCSRVNCQFKRREYLSDLSANSAVKFDKNQEITKAVFELYRIDNNRFEKIVQWKYDQDYPGLYEVVLSLNRSKISITSSVCSKPCPPGQFPFIEANRKCCWICKLCPPNYYKPNVGNGECVECKPKNVTNLQRTVCFPLSKDKWSVIENWIIYGLAVIGVFLTGFSIGCFIVKRDTPVVRSSSFEISIIQLTLHLLLFVFPFSYFGEETVAKCAVRQYTGGFFVVIIIGITIVKITRLRTIFKMKRLFTQSERQKQKNQQVIALMFLSVVYAAIVTVTYRIQPISINETTDFKEHLVYVTCEVRLFFDGYVFYVLIISLVCCIQSICNVNIVHGKYNEIKYVTFAIFSSTLILLASIPLRLTLSAGKKLEILLSFVTLLTNYSLFLFLHTKKVYIICFAPEKNTRSNFLSFSRSNSPSNTRCNVAPKT